MELSYFHVAKDVPSGIKPETSVVIDVLRATTTIACALNNGAEAVQTFADLDNLKEQASCWPLSKRLLLGERGGKKIDGFDLGNSPLAVTSNVVKGKRLFMSTTNGTRSLERVKESKSLYTMSFINRKAVAEKLISNQSKSVLILGSGWEGAYSLEDSLAAGALASFLLNKNPNSVHILNDELSAAVALWSCWENNIEGCLRNATHGKRLERLGNHDDDFTCCSELDKICVVPTQREKGVLCSL
ncbi:MULTISPECIES: 2-phosphosulfolactate phosphatase family protein [Prochlorococcus]|uniref:Probable 2-phosphosulfolactate phosphatase n=1 Tax=Prochlorococcus marinus (strain SARG / CCMP1375 / SS120) TaxID=167539 RepID=COMB_PROMA|nr:MULTISPECIES: 2-phosphosulfolactate phosphatase family protein [Prochlorococcus]Q7VBP6.1 RecName: Full=Probable 2-phosphosulfolactate phosphatase [Prochlorococcus marinus subsp. marinus str. CCMP1375]AAQ00091.1 Phosphosulfolactate phosphohydrolase related enzyme [Prochlorococcus marinus subsp. marinus str. CCMP1375]KGG13887.1 2-phosphosulfolactate phosphatase [Prochlorococcus marinus str. LG]KGG19020.1 2-phosphosulfolactate phosphatase [Prochlorococcus marinus str. SS2]KGG23440.1 2-phosphos